MKTFLPQEWENVRSDETKPSVNKAQDINTQTSSSNNNDEDTRLKGAPDKPCGEDARMLTQNCR